MRRNCVPGSTWYEERWSPDLSARSGQDGNPHERLYGRDHRKNIALRSEVVIPSLRAIHPFVGKTEDVLDG